MSVPAPETDNPDDDMVVGVVGSPSSTGEITLDVVEAASAQPLLGDLIYTCHPLEGDRYFLALGTVGEIETRNRWHEDPNMRGVLRRHGSLPHLSADGDVRTATVRVQAVYRTDASRPPFTTDPRESGGALAMSPTTGHDVRRVTENLVQSLTASHAHEVAYLGRIYRSPVRLPMYVRDFTGPATDGAFHTGVFGRSGSGKTALVTYLLAIQMRHPNLSVFVFDPQGQFTHQRGLVLDLNRYAHAYGRPVYTVSIAEDLRLNKDVPLVIELLAETEFLRQLTVKGANREAAIDELIRTLRGIDDWDEKEPADVVRQLLSDLIGDQGALARIYSTPAPRTRFVDAMQAALADDRDFTPLVRAFAPIHSLFTRTRPDGKQRLSLEWLLHQVMDTEVSPKPYVVVDLSARSGTPWLDHTETKARLMRKIAADLRRLAEDAWRQSDRLINCSVVFDEAHRFAAPNPDGEETARLSSRLVECVRETRKTGLGWTFITQEIGSLNPGIFNQLTIRAYGYGMTSGSDLNRLRDEIGRGAALDLYQSFPDPKSLSDKVYPFMFSGPISPLTFTAAPVFLEVFTDERDFRQANADLVPHDAAG